jgi:hypothetical protein
MTNKDISVLLATRGRTETLSRSLASLVNLADDVNRIELLLALDRDDDVGRHHFQHHVRAWLDDRGITYSAMLFEPLGYIRLNQYNNKMAARAQGHWFVIWNDDAVMETPGWDTVIMQHRDLFRLLAFHTHNDHPYSIFPILPRVWYDLLGYISPHPTQDGWLSQQAYMLDIWQRIPVWVKHDRYDLTGNNNDPTFQRRAMLEGKPSDPLDFHSVEQIELRHRDCARLATYLRNTLGYDMTFFERVMSGQQDPWEKLAQNDVNRQMVQFANPHTHFAKSKNQSSIAGQTTVSYAGIK